MTPDVKLKSIDWMKTLVFYEFNSLQIGLSNGLSSPVFGVEQDYDPNPVFKTDRFSFDPNVTIREVKVLDGEIIAWQKTNQLLFIYDFLDSTGNTIDSYDPYPQNVSSYTTEIKIDENEELIGVYGH